MEGDPLLVLREQTRPRLSEAHGLAAPRLKLTEEQEPKPDEEKHREPADQKRVPEARVVAQLVLGPDVMLRQKLGASLVIDGTNAAERLVRARAAFNDLILDPDLCDLAVFELSHELRVADFVALLGGAAPEAEDGQQHQDAHRQGHHVLVEGIQAVSSDLRR